MMSQHNQVRGRFGGRSRGGERDGGRGGQRDGGRYAGRFQGAQISRAYAKPPDDEENFMFDIYPNRVETVKFVNAQRKLCDYVATRYPDVSKIFSHGVVVSYDIPEAPEFQRGEDPNNFLRDQYRERVKMLMKREDDFKFNMKLTYGVLWKHCSLALQNSLRSMSEYEEYSSEEDVHALWTDIKRLCTVGVLTNADPEKVQRDADFRFVKVHQYNNESVTAFYDRYLQEVNAWIEAGNAFVDAELIMEGDGEDAAIDETNPRVRAIRARIQEKSEKKKAMNFLTKLDRNRFTSLLDELANDLAKGKNNYPNGVVDAMQLAQTYRSEGRIIGDMVSSSKDVEESVYVTQSYNKNKNKSYKRKVEVVDEEDDKKSLSHIECYLCKQPGHYRNKCPLLAEAEKYLNKTKKSKTDNATKQVTVAKSVKSTKKSDGDDELVFVTHEIALASRKALLDEYDILCDNQATISIFRNRNMLVNITKTDDAISVGGVGGILDVDQIGELPGFGRVYYSPDCMANILCFHDLASKELISFDKERNLFKVKLFGKDCNFVPKGKLYVYNARVMKRKYEALTDHVSLPIKTVDANIRMFSERQRKNAALAREAQMRMGYPSV